MVLPQQPIILTKNIIAIAIDGAPDRIPRNTSLTQLPTGTAVTIMGDGFNNRTVKVYCNGCLYFVYLRDIEEPDSSYYLP